MIDVLVSSKETPAVIGIVAIPPAGFLRDRAIQVKEKGSGLCRVEIEIAYLGPPST